MKNKLHRLYVGFKLFVWATFGKPFTLRFGGKRVCFIGEWVGDRADWLLELNKGYLLVINRPVLDTEEDIIRDLAFNKLDIFGNLKR